MLRCPIAASDVGEWCTTTNAARTRPAACNHNYLPPDKWANASLTFTCDDCYCYYFADDNEINAKGEVYRELGDSGSYGYVAGTMTEFMLLARASSLAGVDMYSYKNASNGFGDLEKSLRWMAPYCSKVRHSIFHDCAPQGALCG